MVGPPGCDPGSLVEPSLVLRPRLGVVLALTLQVSVSRPSCVSSRYSFGASDIESCYRQSEFILLNRTITVTDYMKQARGYAGHVDAARHNLNAK